MRSFFPFEVGVVNSEKEIEKYGLLEEFYVFDSSEICNFPFKFKLYIEKKIYNTLPDPCIFDYFKHDDVELYFIQPNPDEDLSKYDIYKCE
ncbi:MAG: hypothetical protein ACTSRZ_10155 [Promethearchaeota archaeon]